VPRIATRLIATALLTGNWKTRIKTGTIMKPPPRPTSEEGAPTAKPTAKTKNTSIIFMEIKKQNRSMI
jgi:hypothetical protein